MLEGRVAKLLAGTDYALDEDQGLDAYGLGLMAVDLKALENVDDEFSNCFALWKLDPTAAVF